jgi:hypothetical protein
MDSFKSFLNLFGADEKVGSELWFEWVTKG